jgi:hypothetical protein
MQEIERQIIRVDSWQDIFDRADHRRDIDPKKTKLLQILAGYEFKDDQPCGLIGKHPHRRGFLVVIEGELTTHIGRDCAATHFGSDVVKGLLGSFTAAEDRRNQAERFQKQVARLPELNAEYLALSMVVHQASNAVDIFMRKLPSALCNKVLVRAQHQDVAVEDSRMRTAAEISDLVARGDRRPREQLIYESVHVGTLQGLSAVIDGPKVKRSLHEKVLMPIKALERAHKQGATVVRSIVQDVDGIPSVARKARAYCAEGSKFLARENKDLIQLIGQIHRIAA